MPSTKKLKPTEILKMIFRGEKIKTFIDTNTHPYIVTPELPYHAIAVNSQAFGNYWRSKYIEIENKDKEKEIPFPSLTSYSLNDFSEWVQSQSAFKGNQHKLWLRTAQKENEDTYYYDIGDGKNIIKITPDNWTIINNQNNEDVYFKQSIFKSPQLLPDPKAKIEDIFLLDKYLNISSKTDRKIIYAYLVTALHPVISIMILNIHGIKGSTKTTTFRLLKSLIDPSPIRSHPSGDASLVDEVYDRKELMQRTGQQYCLYLDNISYVKSWLSDAIARVATGTVMSDRALYTDNDYILYDDRPILGINGINLTTTAPDVLQRSLIIEIDRPDTRISDIKIWREFKQDKAKIFGAMITAFARSIEGYNKMQIDENYTIRMADYGEFSAAVAQTLGFNKEKYLVALKANTDNQNLKGVENSPTAMMLMKYIEAIMTKTEIRMIELHKELVKLADNYDYKVGRRIDEFPHTAQRFGIELNKVIGNLYEMGYPIYKGPKKNDGRYYIVEPKGDKPTEEKEEEWDKLLAG